MVVDTLALMPGFLEPVTLLNSFGTWTLAGLLLVVFIESGLLFPLLPGDSLLFIAGWWPPAAPRRSRRLRTTVGADALHPDRGDPR